MSDLYRMEFDAKGEKRVERVLKGDKGQQGSLLGSPAQTGESLPVTDLPMFEDRCEHGMFFSGAGACPQCGGGAEPPVPPMFCEGRGDCCDSDTWTPCSCGCHA